MGNEIATIPTTGDIGDWTESERALAEFVGLVKKRGDGDKAVMVPAPRAVREAFAVAVQRTQLDPLAKQIYAAEIGGKWTILVGIDGLRLTAQRSREYEGQDEAQWTADGEKWVEVWLSDPNPAAARVGVYRKNFRKAVIGIATWKGYGKTTGQWVNNGPHMLAKCAEALALRKAFPMECSGLYIIEEFQGGNEPDDFDGGRDWEAEALQIESIEELSDLFSEMKDSGEWTQNLDAKFRARKMILAEEANPQETIVVGEPSA
jgi:phage recombination protein Bet